MCCKLQLVTTFNVELRAIAKAFFYKLEEVHSKSQNQSKLKLSVENEKISRGSLNMVVQESEAIIEKVKKASENKDFLSIIYLFEVVKHFDKMKSRLQGISKQAFHP